VLAEAIGAEELEMVQSKLENMKVEDNDVES